MSTTICRRCHRLRDVSRGGYCATCSAILRADEKRRPAAVDAAVLTPSLAPVETVIALHEVASTLPPPPEPPPVVAAPPAATPLPHGDPPPQDALPAFVLPTMEGEVPYDF